MKTLPRYSQSSAHNSVAGGSLRVSGVLSPYAHMIDTSAVGTRRNTNHILVMLTAYYMGYGVTGLDGSVEMVLRDSNNIYNFSTNVPLTVVGTDTEATLSSRVSSSVASFLITNGLTAPDVEIWLFNPTEQVRTFTYPTLAVNTARQVTNDTMVNASVSITSTISLTTGQTGTVSLQYADNSGFTTNLVTVQSFSNGNTGSLTIGLNLSQVATAALTGIVPAGKYYRLLTTNVTGTPTYGTPVVQEVLL